jgi:CBS-domain-containing membrane protein
MQKYNMLMAQIGCAAIGVLAFTLFGPGWLAKSASVAACVAYMIYTDTIHPPGTFASLWFETSIYLSPALLSPQTLRYVQP